MGRKRPRPAGLLDPGAPLPAAHRVALSAAFVLIALLSIRQVQSPDIGFHLATGKSILAGNGWPTTDPFTFTVPTHMYTDTSWGYDVFVALVERVFGAPGLVLFHTLAVLALFAVLYRTARLAPVDPTTLVALVLAGGIASELRFSTRPELVSYLLLAAVLHILHRHAAGRASPLWAIPAIHLAWANLHGLFALGFGATGCFLVGIALRDRRVDRRLLAVLAASFAVSFLNPYGAAGVLFPLRLATRIQHVNVFKQLIGEFISPFSPELARQFPFFSQLPVIVAFRALAALSVVAVVPLARARRYAEILLWLAFGSLAALMFRNIPLLAVAALPGTIWALPAGRLLDALRLAGGRRRAAVGAALGFVVVAAAALGLTVVHDAYYVASRRPERFGLGWNALELPADAAGYADRAGLRGPVLNHLSFGGYLLWAREDPVFIDGRLEVMGEEFFLHYNRVLASQDSLEAAVARHGIRWTIFPYALSGDLVARMGRDARWRLAYLDHLAAVYVRDGAGAAALVDSSVASLAAGAPDEIAFESLPGIGGNRRVAPSEIWLRGLVARQTYPREELYRGLFHYYRGEFDLARRWFARAIRSSRGAYYEIYNNLGSALMSAGKAEEARACYRIVLRDHPRNRVALDRLAALERGRPTP